MIVWEASPVVVNEVESRFHIIIEGEDINSGGILVDMYASLIADDRPILFAVKSGEGVSMKFGLEWRFAWHSEGVEEATITLVDEEGKRRVGISWDKKTVVGMISAEQVHGMIRCDSEGYPELKIMYSPDLVSRAKLVSKIIDGVQLHVAAVEAAAGEVESGD
jgi:hypothetical protein